MNTAMEIVRAVEANGGRLSIEDDEFLIIVPKRAGLPFVEDLKRHKPEIMAVLRSGMASNVSASPTLTMPAGVRLIAYEPKQAPVRLSECSTVTDVDKFIGSTLRQLDAKLSGKSWLAGNWSLSTLLERLAAVGVDVVLDDPSQALQ